MSHRAQVLARGIGVLLGVCLSPGSAWAAFPTMRAAEVTPSSCGEVRVAAQVRGRDLVFAVDGREDHLGTHFFLSSFSAGGYARPGTPIPVTLTSRGRVVAEEVLLAPEWPLQVRVALHEAAWAGERVRIDLDLSESCPSKRLMAEVSVGASTAAVALWGRSNPVWLTLPETPGDAELRVVVRFVEADPAGDGAAAGEGTAAEELPPLRTIVQAVTVLDPDADHDGHRSVAAGGLDCDDAEPAVHPGAREGREPNGRDEDCDGRVDEGTRAYDDDGDGLSEDQGDCDDADTRLFPGAVEVADCRDQDCDGEIDEGAAPLDPDDYAAHARAETAYDLKTEGARSFVQMFELVMSPGEERWFRFYLQDGDWDLFGGSIQVQRMAPGAAYDLAIGERLSPRAKGVRADTSGVDASVDGSAFYDDSGHYYARVRALSERTCPLTVGIAGR